MDDVGDATTEVRLSTDQQRVATEQVVQTMSSVSVASRQSAATAEQLAASATRIADLAAELEASARTFVTAEQPVGDGGPGTEIAPPRTTSLGIGPRSSAGLAGKAAPAGNGRPPVREDIAH